MRPNFDWTLSLLARENFECVESALQVEFAGSHFSARTAIWVTIRMLFNEVTPTYVLRSIQGLAPYPTHSGGPNLDFEITGFGVRLLEHRSRTGQIK